MIHLKLLLGPGSNWYFRIPALEMWSKDVTIVRNWVKGTEDLSVFYFLQVPMN